MEQNSERVTNNEPTFAPYRIPVHRCTLQAEATNIIMKKGHSMLTPQPCRLPLALSLCGRKPGIHSQAIVPHPGVLHSLIHQSGRFIKYQRQGPGTYPHPTLRTWSYTHPNFPVMKAGMALNSKRPEVSSTKKSSAKLVSV